MLPLEPKPWPTAAALCMPRSPAVTPTTLGTAPWQGLPALSPTIHVPDLPTRQRNMAQRADRCHVVREKWKAQLGPWFHTYPVPSYVTHTWKPRGEKKQAKPGWKCWPGRRGPGGGSGGHAGWGSCRMGATGHSRQGTA